jgi:hypothetical protein
MRDRLSQARRMLDTFTSVGADSFDASRIGMDGKLIAFRPDLASAELKRMLPAALESAEPGRHNVIIRPRGTVPLVQLDDLSSTQLHRVAPVAFISVETSPNNFQSWFAIEGGTADIARRLRKGTGADLNASGSVRLAGSHNYKAKYSPDYPVVSITDATPGRIVTAKAITPLLAPAEPQSWVARVTATRQKRWPDYERIIAGAPPNHSGDGADVSRADYLYARISAQFGNAPDAIAAKLLEVSPKAKREGERYATRTAVAAAAALSR